MLTVTKRFNICYGHHLPLYKGKCIRYHGHNADVEVTFSKPGDKIDCYPTMIIDFRDIKEQVGSILDKLDHYNLNEMFDLPTCENIVEWIVGEILKLPIGSGLVMLKLTEGPDSWCTWGK